MNYFHRQIQLWGEKTQNLLQEKSIAIIGCGGLGSTLGISLGSSGIGKIHLVDFDTVSTHNIHRQIAFKIGDEDKKKADILNELVLQRYDKVDVQTHICSFDEFAEKNIEVDLIIDGTDNLPSRKKIDKYAKKVKTPWIYGSVEEFNFQICFFEKSDFGSFVISNKTPSGIAGPIVIQAASFQANLALRYLAGLKVKKDFLYYVYFDAEGQLKLRNFQMPL